MRRLAIIMILEIIALAASIAYMKGWDRGYEAGWKTGVADVLFKKVDPETYFKGKLRVPNHRTN